MGKNGKKKKNKDNNHPGQPFEATATAVADSANGKLKRKEYEKLLIELQIELLKLQKWVVKEGRKVCILFEGRDGAGKGGTILRVMQHLNPRSARKVALGVPTDQEKGQWYYQRYARHLPTSGEIVLYDRSWYNRAGVERVMDFCTKEQYEEFMRATPEFETMLVNSGIDLVKIWLDITKDEQHRRLDARREDPLKHWKLSPMDEFALKKWDEYTKCKHEMFRRTHLPQAPWFVVKFNDKKRGRINTIRGLLYKFDYKGKDSKVACEPDFSIVGNALNPEFGM